MDRTRDTVIEVRGLRNQFGSHVVHDGLDLDVYRGEILGVVGGSGTGLHQKIRSKDGGAAEAINVRGFDPQFSRDGRYLSAITRTDKLPTARNIVVMEIGRWDEARLVTAYEDEEVRWHVARALRVHDHESARAALRVMADEDPSPMVRDVCRNENPEEL